MKIDIKIKKETIKCGDLVHSKSLNEAGFIGYINNNYYFIDKNNFENFSGPHICLEELVSALELELVAKNKDIRISMNTY